MDPADLNVVKHRSIIGTMANRFCTDSTFKTELLLTAVNLFEARAMQPPYNMEMHLIWNLVRSFPRTPARTSFQVFSHFWGHEVPFDNPFDNVFTMKEKMYAAGDGKFIFEIDPITLDTLNRLDLEKEFPGKTIIFNASMGILCPNKTTGEVFCVITHPRQNPNQRQQARSHL